MSSPNHQPIPFAVPDIGEREIEAVTDVLRSKWLTTGAVTREFEGQFAERVDAPHAIALNSCTAALHLSLEALGVGPGDAVFVPTYTFAASGEVVRYVGAEPVLVDVDPVTLCIDTEELRLRIEKVAAEGTLRPAAVIPVHYAGVAADLDAIWSLAGEFGLAVVEDAAHAFPSTHAGRPIGWTPEDVPSTVCFSFYATKTITTGEGGMVTTRSEEVADRIRLMSLHGLSKQAWNRYAGGTWKYDVVAPGYKYNLTDLASAMGLVQLDRAVSMAERRGAIAAAYNRAFVDLELELPRESEGHAWHLYPLRLGARFSEADRDATINALRERGIGTSMHFIPLHLHSYYRDNWGYQPEDYPVAYDVYRRSFSLPIYSGMTDDQLARVIAAVEDVHALLPQST